MKKFIIGAVMALASSVALAGASIGLEYDMFNQTNGPHLNSVTIDPTYSTGPYAFDARLSHLFVDGNSLSNATINIAEGRVARNFDLTTDLSVFVRGGVGEVFADQANGADRGFYSVEPGMTYNLMPKVSLNVSDRYVNDFSGSLDRSNTVFLGADYALTNLDTVGAKLYTETGNFAGNGVRVAYTRKF